MLENGMRYRVGFDCSGLCCWQAFCTYKRLCRAQRHAPRHTGGDVVMRETRRDEEKRYGTREMGTICRSCHALAGDASPAGIIFWREPVGFGRIHEAPAVKSLTPKIRWWSKRRSLG